MNLRCKIIVGSKAFLVFAGVSAGFYASNGAARASDLSGQASARAEAQCAAYGPGFRAIEGGDACVFVGGHIRVGFGSRVGGSANNGWASGGALPVNASGDRAAAAPLATGHLRLPAGDAPGTIAR
jgi:hypothetical protein